MNKLIFSALATLCISTFSLAQTFVVHPYLQDATPSSITIMWETDSGSETVVNYGETENDLSNTVNGSSLTTDGGGIMHEAEITAGSNYTYKFILE